MPLAFAAVQRIVTARVERTIGESRRKETGKVQAGLVVVPDQLPAGRSLQVLLLIARALSCSDLAQREVVETVFHGSRDAARVAVLRDVAQLQPVGQSTSSFLRAGRVVCGVVSVVRHHLGVLHHRCVAVGPVDGPPQPFDIGVGEDVVRVRASLH